MERRHGRGGVPAKSVNDAKLAFLRAVLNHAVANEKLTTNPASNVAATGSKGKRKGGTKMLGYDDHEAQTILAAAVVNTRPAIRWVALLCAVTGARVSEMMQLRKEDVLVEGGVWNIKITEDAGPLKNAPSERTLPLHPCLVQRGFLDFVSDKPKGRLFFSEARRRATSTSKPGKGTTNHLREFIHGVAEAQELKIGRKHRKDPNHAWLYRFMTLARRHHMDSEKREYLVGHALDDEGYGDMAGLLVELAKLPDPLTGELLPSDLSRTPRVTLLPSH